MRVIIATILLLASIAQAQDPAAQAVVVIGEVSVERLNGALQGLNANDEIYLKERVQTGVDGLAKLLLRDESVLKISPESDVVISAMVAGPGADGDSTVDLLKGRLRSVIGNKISNNSKYEINTPVAVAGVRGTDFEVVHVLVNGSWITGVRCYDGAVEFSRGETSVVLLPNRYSLITDGKTVSEPEIIDTEKSVLDVIIESKPNEIESIKLPEDQKLDDVQIVESLLGLEEISIETFEQIQQEIYQETIQTVADPEIKPQELELPQVEVLESFSVPSTQIDLDIKIPTTR